MCRWRFFRFRFAEPDPARYKAAIKLISAFIIICQVVRIGVVIYELRETHLGEYPGDSSLAFGIISLVVGIVSIGLEALLLISIKRRKMNGIQPWFVATFLLFLIGSLATVLSFSIYVINPLEHNYRYKHGKYEPFHSYTDETEFVLFNNTRFSISAERVQGTIRNIRLNSTTFGKIQNEWDVTRKEIKSIKTSHVPKPFLEHYLDIRPVIPVTFLIEALRALPQLHIVNQFVKAERLHLAHIHSHASLAALYVKHV